MHVAIDTTPLNTGHSVRGIGTYTRILKTGLPQLKGNHTYLFTDKPYLSRADVVHLPYFDLFFHTLPIYKPIPTVITIHDVIPLIYPRYYPKGLKGAWRLLQQRISLSTVAAIITDSNCSKNDIHRYLLIPEDRIYPIYLAPNPHLSPATPEAVKHLKKEYQLRRPYFLYVGDINYNKNIGGLVRAFVPFKATHDLVLISPALGGPSQEAADIHHLIDRLGVRSEVRIIDSLAPANEPALAAMYTGADWYIQPSFYEGFGLPVLEAMACGTPVICATGGSLPEIGGESPLWFDPQLAQALEQMLTTAIALPLPQRNKRIEKGFDWLTRFSYEKTASETQAIYEKVASIK